MNTHRTLKYAKSLLGVCSLSGVSVYAYYSESKAFKIATAGVLSSMITDLVNHPIDIVNVRTKSNFELSLNSRNTANSIFKYKGLSGFFVGVNFLLVSSFFSGLLYFSAYTQLKGIIKQFCQTHDIPFSLAYCTASFLSECVQFIFYYPFDFLKNRITTERYYYFSVVDAFKKVKTEAISEGKIGNLAYIRKFYFGFLSSMLQSSCQVTIMFTSFEMCRDKIAEYKGIKAEEVRGVEYLTCALVGGFASASLLNFLEVYSIQRQILGDKISFIQFIKTQDRKAFTSGFLSKAAFGVFYTVVLLESVKILGDIFDVSI